jgi:CBS domain-containing protein
MTNDQYPVSKIMSRKVISVTPQMPIERLILLLVDEDIGGALVVDPYGRAIGTVDKGDLVADDYEWAKMREETQPWQRIGGSRVARDEGLFTERLRASQLVADIMSPISFSLNPDDTVGRAAALMVANHLHRLPVLDESGRVIGIVTQFDITRWMAQQLGALGPGALR